MVESFLEPVKSKHNHGGVNDEDISDGSEEKYTEL